MSDEVERTLCQLPQCHVFKIPTRKSAEGYRASDWPQTPVWSGRIKIAAKGRLAVISLIDDKNSIFALCPVTDDTAVERTLDSGRYFVLRIQNAQKQHAFIGIAFNERNDAFDFNVALNEFRAECSREDQAADAGVAVSVLLQDLTLKEGEKIKINIVGKKKKEGTDADFIDSGVGTAAGSTVKKIVSPTKIGFLAPPPAVSMTGAPILTSSSTTSTSASSSNSSDSSDPWNTSVFSTSTTTAAQSDPWSASDDPFASTTTAGDPWGGGFP